MERVPGFDFVALSAPFTGGDELYQGRMGALHWECKYTLVEESIILCPLIFVYILFKLYIQSDGKVILHYFRRFLRLPILPNYGPLSVSQSLSQSLFVTDLRFVHHL